MHTHSLVLWEGTYEHTRQQEMGLEEGVRAEDQARTLRSQTRNLYALLFGVSAKERK